MSFEDQSISWSEFYKAYSGIRFTIKNGCQVFVPNYSNISHSTTERVSGNEMMTLALSGTDMTFQDEWSSKAFLVAGSPERLDKVFIKDLWEYPENNILFDDFLQTLAFKDIEVEETNLQDFVKDLDSFLVFNKVDSFGDVWWVANVKANIESDDSQYSNVEVVNVSGSDITPTTSIKFWSPDKYVNDEYKRYVSNPTTYSGFLTSDDFENGGWFSVPHLRISTKPFEKLKIAQILLNLNYTFDPTPYLGTYYSINSGLGARIKDNTSLQILDSSQNKGPQNTGRYSDTIISSWVGGLINTENIETFGILGNFIEDTCQLKKDQINNVVVQDNQNDVSHVIDTQITLNPDYSSDRIDFLGTIDPINWISSDNDKTENIHKIGSLNINRAFGGASGDIDNGIIVGGIITSDSTTEVTQTSEIWQNDTFIRNVLINTNAPRCFHIQGGSGSNTCAIIGGYSDINSSDFTQFSRYGKTNVRNDLEYFITNDDSDISFFSRIADYSMNIARGECAGHLDVKTNVRQDKFQVESLIAEYNVTPNDEQKILQFVNDASNDIVNDVPVPSNFRRYNISNIEGFVFAGNKTGNVYLIDTPENDDIISSFESIKTTYIDVSQNESVIVNDDNSIDGFLSRIDIGEIESVVSSVLSIPGTNNTGVTLSLNNCGKYKIVYTEGHYNYNDVQSKAGELIDNVLSINSTTGNGESTYLPYCGKYRIQYLNGTWRAWETDPQTRTALSVFLNGVYKDNIFSTINISGGADYYYDICVDNENSLLRLAVTDSFWGDNLGFVNVSVTYLGVEECTSCNVSTSAYGSDTKLLLNEQEIDTIFQSGIQPSAMDVEYFNNSRPTRKEYTFCVSVPNSQIRLYAIDLSDNNYENNGGFVNAQVYYLGEGECPCIIEESESLSQQNDITVTYGENDPTRTYPVRCHGHLYIGTNEAGISTGGRTEYNTISNVECLLRQKYGLVAKNTCVENTISLNPLESNRVLDLVYEYDGFTWVRKQNLFESVYYHTGVGSVDNAIIWGGLHDTLNVFSYNYSIDTDDVQTIPLSSFDCDDNKNITVVEDTTYGVEYEILTDLVNSSCWFTPTWETTSVSGDKLDNPRYRPGNATLAFAQDDNFPNILVASVGPTNPTSFTTQSVSGATYSIPSSNKLNITNKIYTDNEASFTAVAYVLNDDDTVSNKVVNGTLSVSQINYINITSLDYDIYPAPAYTGTLEIELTDIRVISGGNVLIYYTINHYGPSSFVFRGYGILTFTSMQDIWESIKNDTSIIAVTNTFVIQESSESPNLQNEIISGTAELTFTSSEESAVLIGVENVIESWNTENCNLTITDFVDFTASQNNGDVKRWGHPVWVSGLVQDISGLFSIDYSYSKSIGISDDKNGVNIFEVGEIQIESNNISSFINNRLLIKGETINQTHEFDAMTNLSFINGSTASPSSDPLNLNTYCESISATSSQSISAAFDGVGYSEWATSFIQEYRSDERFSLPQAFIPSNYYDIIGNNTQLNYVKSSWKRFMDGVGLGGDVPDYSSIVDKDGNKQPITNWRNIGTWHVGQMAFGTPERAVIAGGHKVDPTKLKVGIHAYDTTSRVFVWDFANIPPEDSYLSNYLGRRLWDFYIDDNGILVPNDTVSSIGMNIFNAESTVTLERHGSIIFDGSTNRQTVTFTSPLPDSVSSYSITLLPNDNIKCWWDAKSNSGFNIVIESSTWSGVIDYTVVAQILTTEKNISDLDALDGYIFNGE